jgi:hypothetical protein
MSLNKEKIGAKGRNKILFDKCLKVATINETSDTVIYYSFFYYFRAFYVNFIELDISNS